MKIDKLLPKDLDEAVDLLKTFYKDEIENIKSLSEDEFNSNVHHAGGQFIRNTWFLWWYEGHQFHDAWPKEKPAIKQWFEDRKIVHADDISGIIMTCFYRNINGLDYKLDEQIKKYHDHWKGMGYSDGIPKSG